MRNWQTHKLETGSISMPSNQEFLTVSKTLDELLAKEVDFFTQNSVGIISTDFVGESELPGWGREVLWWRHFENHTGAVGDGGAIDVFLFYAAERFPDDWPATPDAVRIWVGARIEHPEQPSRECLSEILTIPLATIFNDGIAKVIWPIVERCRKSIATAEE